MLTLHVVKCREARPTLCRGEMKNTPRILLPSRETRNVLITFHHFTNRVSAAANDLVDT